jgi:hypothetical protein
MSRSGGLGVLCAVSALFVLVHCTGAGEGTEPVPSGDPTTSPYAFAKAGAVHRARNDAHSLSVTFDAGAMTLRPTMGSSPWEARLRTSCIGRAAQCDPPPIDAVHVHGSRIEHVRGPWREWFENGPLGVEQGFTIEERPPGDGEILVAIAIDGLRASLRETGGSSAQEASLHASRGGPSLVRVHGLRAFDAGGRSLRTWMTTDGAVLGLHVDDRDARYPIAIDPVYGSEIATLAGADGAAYDEAGVSVSLSGDTAIVGANHHNPSGKNDAGAAYVFVRSVGSWSEQAKLVASDGLAGDLLGHSVAVATDIAIAGAPWSDPATKSMAGAAYVFARSGTVWAQQAKLVASDGAASEYFGWAVSATGDTVVVGARDANVSGKAGAGAAYVFVRSGTTWTEQAKLVASDGLASDKFGESVSASGDTVLVGAVGRSSAKGAAYVFVRTGTTWTEQARLTASDALQSDFFGRSVSLSGDTAIAGAYGADPAGTSGAGAAYVFVRSGTTWSQQAKLVASDALPSDSFGRSVSVSIDSAVIGAHYVDTTTKVDAGAAYVFRRSGTTWTQEAKLVAPAPNSFDLFGEAVSLSGDTVLCGAHRADPSGRIDGGAGYAYRLAPTKMLGVACASNVECTSGVCVEGICCDRTCDGPCVACTATKKGSGTDGTCGAVAADTDPKDGCVPGSGTCAADGSCDGAGNCRSFAKAGTPCGATTCTTGTVTGKICKGDSAVCVDTSTACAPYACATMACKTSCATDADCAAESFCSSGSCTTKRAAAAGCTEARECASGFCVDAVCCNSACTGQCEACDGTATKGTCTPVMGAPKTGRMACGGAGACAGSCDGLNGGSCAFPAGAECAATCTNNQQTLSRCDAIGACKPSASESCNGFACEGSTRCKTTCASASDCAPGLSCTGGKCEPDASKCSDDRREVIAPDGTRTSCGITTCKAGKCVATCTGSDDCAAGYVCNGGRCEQPAVLSDTGDDGGCAASPTHCGAGSTGALVVAFGALYLVFRRRRAAASMRVPVAVVAAMLMQCTSGGREDASRGAAAYAFQPMGESHVAQNAGLDMIFEGGAMTLRPRGDRASWRAQVRLSCVGRATRCLERAIDAVRVSGSRLEHVRGSLLEWYENGPLGVEQGLTIAEPPAGDGELLVTLAIEGLEPSRETDGLAMLRSGGRAVVRVDGLCAVDARGIELRAWMTVVGDTLSLHVDERGAQYPIVIDPMYGAEEAKLVASDVAGTDGLGNAIALSGDTAIVGSPSADPAGKMSAGASYVFVRSGTTWAQQTKLLASDGLTGDNFGRAVSIDGDTAVVGASSADPSGKASAGAAYVFVRSGTTWTEQAKLLADDGAADDTFGDSVSIHGDTLIVGASRADVGGIVNVGAAYVFVRSGTTWTQQAKLVASDRLAGDALGSSASLKLDTAVLGAPEADPSGRSSAGAAYVFVRSGTTWTQQAKLLASDGTAVDKFGIAISLSGETALIGASQADPGPATGAAYVFVRSGTTWAQQAKLVASDGLSSDYFGVAVSLSGDLAVIGAEYASLVGRSQAGTAYVYARGGTSWTQEAKLIAFDGAKDDGFGRSVALDTGTAVIGAPRAAISGKLYAGAAYAYRVSSTKGTGSACASAIECTSGFCVDGFCCDRACTGPCEGCAAAMKASGTDGACGPIKVDTDPKSACPTSTITCGADGLCDGTGSCRSFAKPGTACGATTCAAGSMTGKLCKGDAAECVEKVTVCAPYACDVTACKTSCVGDSDCAAEAYCLAGACTPKSAGGAACTAGRECANGFCVDGVCCNSACGGQCEACDEPTSRGTCTPVKIAPKGGRMACAGAGTACAGTCDGVNGGSCSYPAGTQCNAACGDAELTLSRCDASGACKPSAPQGCDGYACEDASRCKTSCSAKSDCAPKFTCKDSKCVADTGTCSTDGAEVVAVDGARTSCGATRCRDGRCLETCEISNDCAANHACNQGRCERVATADTSDSGGCTTSARGAGPIGWMAPIALALVVRRRRRRRRQWGHAA